MKLERGQELYSEYRDGSLSPAMRLALEQHFQTDDTARADYDNFARAMSLLENTAFEELEAPHGFRASVMERVAAAHAAREQKPQGFMERLADWFGQPKRRELAGAVAGLAAVAVIAVAVIHPAGQISGTNASNIFPVAGTKTLQATIRGVSTEAGTDGNLYHNFQVHLPTSVTNATVNAYVITETDQILDPAVRGRDATPALAAPVELSNDEQMKIPVGLLKQAPSGSTLNMLVEWKPDDPSQPSGSEVVFTPVNPNDTMNPQEAPPSNGNFFDSLQTIASAYHVTVIADSSHAPTASADAWTPGGDPQQALNTVAASEGYKVDVLNPGTYFVHPAQ